MAPGESNNPLKDYLHVSLILNCLATWHFLAAAGPSLSNFPLCALPPVYLYYIYEKLLSAVRWTFLWLTLMQTDKRSFLMQQASLELKITTLLAPDFCSKMLSRTYSAASAAEDVRTLHNDPLITTGAPFDARHSSFLKAPFTPL